jgi:hypothetical protein
MLLTMSILSLLFGCSSCTSANGSEAPGTQAPTVLVDPCCAGGDGVTKDACQDAPIVTHVCGKDSACCTDAWGESCAELYLAFAGTCPEAAPLAISIVEASVEKGAPAVPDMGDRTKHKVPVTIRFDPPPDTVPGNVFYAGFGGLKGADARPDQGTMPDDYGTIGFWLRDFPLERTLELYEGVHYFVLYGQGEFATADDRMSPFHIVTSDAPLEFVIGPALQATQPKKTDDRRRKHTRPAKVDPAKYPLRKVMVSLKIYPPLATTNTAFFAGFAEIEAGKGRPKKGTDPVHFGKLGSASGSAHEAQAKLHSGLHYFFFLGRGEHPTPGDRMSSVVSIKEQDRIEVSISDNTIPTK